MSLWGRIFGTDQAISKTVDTISSGIDALVYTDEEKAGDAAKERAAGRALMVEWLKNSQGQTLARRFLALLITITWLFLYLLAGALSVASVWLKNSPEILQTANIIAEYATQMNGAVMLIIGFYFAAPHLGEIVSGAMSRFGKATPKVK